MNDLDSTALLQGESSSEWRPATDLDTFCDGVYTYFLEKGFVCLVASRVFTAATAAFTVTFTTVTLLCVNWRGIMYECTNEADCNELDLFVSPFSDETFTYLTYVVLLYTILTASIWVLFVLHSLREIWQAIHIRDFYNNRLGIGDDDLPTMSWGDVTEKINAFQKTHKLAPRREVTPHEIANRVMRRENYLIALINRGIMDVSLKLPYIGTCTMYTKTFEWNLWILLLRPMFDTSSRIRRNFLNDVTGLKGRLAFLAVLNMVLSPFLLLGVLNYFFLKYAERIRKETDILSSRRFSPLALWQLREFNELPSVFAARISMCYPHAHAYVQQYPTPLTTMMAKFVSFVLGSMVALLLLIGFLNDEAMIHYRVSSENGGQEDDGHNLLWYIAVLTACLAGTRSLIVETVQDTTHRSTLMNQVILHTHYRPDGWKHHALHSKHVFKQFVSMYRLKAVMFVEELIAILWTPFLLQFVLSKRLPQIVEFIRDFTVETDQMGHVCAFATFNFAQNGDNRYGAPSNCNDSKKAKNGKLEKSYLSFKAHHPDVQVPGGDRLMQNILPSNMSMTQSTLQPSTLQVSPPPFTPPASPPRSPTAPRRFNPLETGAGLSGIPVHGGAGLDPLAPRLSTADPPELLAPPRVVVDAPASGGGGGDGGAEVDVANEGPPEVQPVFSPPTPAMVVSQVSLQSSHMMGASSTYVRGGAVGGSASQHRHIEVGDSYFAWVQKYCDENNHHGETTPVDGVQPHDQIHGSNDADGPAERPPPLELQLELPGQEAV